MAWYSVRLLIRFEVGSQATKVSTYEDRIVVVRAKNPDSAEKKAREIVKRDSVPYKNVLGKTVRQRLSHVFESLELFDREFKDGTQVYWRFIRSCDPVKRLKREGNVNRLR